MRKAINPKIKGQSSAGHLSKQNVLSITKFQNLSPILLYAYLCIY